MVMEAPPSPQSVGREFVRQYYTLLNKAPNHLHRFYNQQSSFVHGGLDPQNRETSPVIGQKQIHQKIQQLNFHDCHAKITQVDSQGTLGGGVVVQVTGELSNAGQPMRRFTQTFVLAAQSPKKYYVHNDIFRYQDEIISDEECDPESRSEPEEEINQECPVIPEVPQQQPVMPFFNANAAPLQPAIQPVPHLHNQPPPHVLGPQTVPAVNGAVHPDDINMLPGQPHVITAGQNLPPPPLPSMQPNLIPNSPPINMEDNLSSNEQNEENPPTYDTLENEQEQQDYSTEQVSSNNEPKTYATLLKSGNSPYGSPPQQQLGPQTFPPARATSPISSNTGYNQNRNLNRNNSRSGPQQPRIPRQDSLRTSGGRNSMNDDLGDDRRRNQSNSYSDINQLFLGNLPHNATEDDLREIFIEFGPISDLRVHSKPGNKAGMPGGRMPPNYGFITFETQQGVQNCLAAKPIFFPKGDKTGTLLNVEEKKTKDRSSYGGRLNNDNRDRNRDRDRDNLPRRGPSGPGPNRNSTAGNGGAGTPPGGPNRPNNYNRSGPPIRGSNTYNNRR
ncbi:hypothetical protein HHI36_017003 [Cryptolaemus montrouzieri]|uniref:Rasputin n=1 Tax=Cryptolaemus montrouzieri TaxID=559131 RepID=A0ABD2NLB6_9CUCU